MNEKQVSSKNKSSFLDDESVEENSNTKNHSLNAVLYPGSYSWSLELRDEVEDLKYIEQYMDMEQKYKIYNYFLNTHESQGIDKEQVYDHFFLFYFVLKENASSKLCLVLEERHPGYKEPNPYKLQFFHPHLKQGSFG